MLTTHRFNMWTACVLLLVVLALAGCSLNRQPVEDPLDVGFKSTLPDEWAPIDTWKPVNIDGDETVEHLLFYRYESGQVGGVIYDFQDGASFAPAPGATPVYAVPQQAGNLFVSYRLLPSYWKGAGQGFLAPPGQDVRFLQATRLTDDQGSTAQGDQADELIVFGGNTHLSIFWWRNVVKGYAVTQISAPGGLKVTEWAGKVGESTILTVDGYFPEANSRSYLCRKVTYHRSLPIDLSPWAGTEHRPPVFYDPIPQGLTFCPSAAVDSDLGYPQQTFYPEATVLAYLLYLRAEHSDAVMDNLVDEAQRAAIVASLGQIERIHSLTFYTTLDIESSLDTADPRSLYMQVVVELVPKPAEQSPSSRSTLAGTTDELRRFTFILNHQPPRLQDPEGKLDPRSDRWLIRDVVRDPGP